MQLLDIRKFTEAKKLLINVTNYWQRYLQLKDKSTHKVKEINSPI